MSDRCEWNPVQDCAAQDPLAPGDCPNEATLSVGRGARGENWHLCASCAALPKFARKRYRKPLVTRRAARRERVTP